MRTGPVLPLFYLIGAPHLWAPVPATIPVRLAAHARCQRQLGVRGGGSRRAWCPCCGGARLWSAPNFIELSRQRIAVAAQIGLYNM
eukprot:COSAG01_NODE_58560_length_305_cov_0.927184_1_plen_85_part_10